MKRSPPRHFWIPAILLLLATLTASGRANAQPDAGTLRIEGDTHYVVPPDGGVVDVTSAVTIRNEDRSTVRRRSGTYYFYDNLSLRVPRSATQVKATRGDGKALRAQLGQKKGDYRELTVSLGRRMFYGDTLRLDLRYRIGPIIGDNLQISPNTISLPGYNPWDAGSVAATLPNSYQVHVQSETCTVRDSAEGDAASTEITCPAQENDGYPLFVVEAVRSAEPRMLTSAPIAMTNGDIALEVHYLAGDEAWAERTTDVLTRAMPVIERIMGFPYTGPNPLIVRASPSDALDGYDGRATSEDELWLGPSADRNTIIHEAAHLWSDPFAETWLFEGWAEWAAREAMRRLKMPLPRFKPAEKLATSYPLQEWQHTQDLSTTDQQDYEDYGYARATDVIDRLVKRAGLEQLQAITRIFLARVDAGEPGADSLTYLQALTDAGIEATRLWERYVLSETGEPAADSTPGETNHP